MHKILRVAGAEPQSSGQRRVQAPEADVLGLQVHLPPWLKWRKEEEVPGREI